MCKSRSFIEYDQFFEIMKTWMNLYARFQEICLNNFFFGLACISCMHVVKLNRNCVQFYNNLIILNRSEFDLLNENIMRVWNISYSTYITMTSFPQWISIQQKNNNKHHSRFLTCRTTLELVRPFKFFNELKNHSFSSPSLDGTFAVKLYLIKVKYRQFN